MAAFSGVPTELAVIIADLLDRGDQAALALTSRFFHRIVNPIIYRDNVKTGNSLCLFWAAHHGEVGTLEHALAYGADLNTPLLPLPEKKDESAGAATTTTATTAPAIATADNAADDQTQNNDNTATNNNANADTNQNNNNIPNSDDEDTGAEDGGGGSTGAAGVGTSAARKEKGKFYTPLAVAAKSGHRHVAEWLLDHGAFIDAPTIRYCDCRLITDVRALVRQPRPGWRPLHGAICHEQLSVAELLIFRGADVHNVSVDEDCKVPALHCAASRGLVSLVKLLALDPELDIDECDFAGNTALHYASLFWPDKSPARILAAARSGSLDTDCRLPAYAIPKLLSLGAEIEHPNRDGFTPLLFACARGNFAAARLLLRAGANPEPHASHIRDFDDVRPSYYCTLAWSTGFGRHVPGQDRAQWEVLRLELLNELIEAGADINARFNRPWRHKATLLMLAAKNGAADIVEALCRAGADVNALDDRNRTAMHVACYDADATWGEDVAAEVVIALLRYGGRVDLGEKAIGLPLDWAIEQVKGSPDKGKRFAVFNAIVENAGPGNVHNASLFAAMRACARSGNSTALRGLLKLKKAIFGVQDHEMKALTDLTISNCNDPDTLSALLEGSRRVESNETLLWKCIESRNHPLTLEVLRRGVAVSDVRMWVNNETFLHMACRWGDMEVVEALLERGADLDVFDVDLQTPLSIAVTNNSRLVVDALLREAADPFLVPSDELIKEVVYFPQAYDGHAAAQRRDFRANFMSAFDLAMLQGRTSILTTILSRCALPPLPPCSADTYIHRACRNLRPDLLQLLLDRGADPNGGEGCPDPPLNGLLRRLRDRGGPRSGPPDLAAHLMYPVTLLLGRGADPFLRDQRYHESAHDILRSIRNQGHPGKTQVRWAKDILCTLKAERSLARTGTAAVLAELEDTGDGPGNDDGPCVCCRRGGEGGIPSATAVADVSAGVASNVLASGLKAATNRALGGLDKEQVSPWYEVRGPH